VHARNDDYGLAEKAIEDSIGETTEKGASRLTIDHRIGGRVLSKLSQGHIDGRKKLFAEAHPLPLIPLIRFLDISSRGRAEE
jgi:hypothetical protein